MRKYQPKKRTNPTSRPNTDSAPEIPSVAASRRAIEYVKIDALSPSPHNVRTHSKKQIRQIAASIDRFGFQPPIIVNADNMILAGHGRVLAARELGLSEIPSVRVNNLSKVEQRAYAIAENKIAQNAGTDREALFTEMTALLELLPELEIPMDPEITGFSVGEIDALQTDFEDVLNRDEDDEITSPDSGPSVSRKDDLWLLGKNRLLCGDARDQRSYKLLLGDAVAEMVITDPPYNVPVKGHVAGRGKFKHQEFAFASGEMSDAQYHEFLTRSLGCMSDACKSGSLFYAFCDWRHVQTFCQVGDELGLRLINICIWNKTTPGQGSFYRSAHELICVFQKPGAGHRNNIELGRFGRSRTNVWTFAAPNKFAGKDDAIRHHPTPKPVTMIAEAIKDASARGDIILDGFLGSGTTILAAERVGRVGYGIEFDPTYVDLTIRRWQTVSGRDAILEATGQTFEAVAKTRTASSRKPPPKTVVASRPAPGRQA